MNEQPALWSTTAEWPRHPTSGPRFAFILTAFSTQDGHTTRSALSHGTTSNPSRGGAFRITWNLPTIVTVDQGGSEDTGLHIDFNHIS